MRVQEVNILVEQPKYYRNVVEFKGTNNEFSLKKWNAERA